MFKKRVVKGVITQNKTDWSAIVGTIFWVCVGLMILGALAGG